jgi:hypothetical protein
MKISNKVLGALLLALVFSFAACKDGSPAADEPILQNSTLAKVVVNVDGVARTLAPSATGLKYNLVISDYSSVVYSEDDITGSSITKELEQGTYNITVWALKADDSFVGKAEKTSIQLKAGETQKVSLTIQPLTGQEAGAGTFTWNFVVPTDEDLGAEINTKRLNPQSPNSANNYAVPLEKDSGSLELPAGRYFLDVVATSNRSINSNTLKAVYQEVVYIYPGFTTNAPYTFTEADFGAKVYFSGTATLYNSQDIADGYTPTQVQLKLANDTVKSANITRDLSNNSYVWAIVDVASDEIANYLNYAEFCFKATATGKSDIFSSWQTESVETTGKTGINLYKY